jgi:Rrf2 family transcriptional regulator, cysteine metabolism repressor
MMFSSKSEYGVRVMVELGRRASADAVVSLAEIAERDRMPLAYLEHLVARLRKAGLVDSRRGARGGYLLARPASQITMAEIVEALEGSIAPIECISLGPDGSVVCSRESEREQVCPTKLLWTRVRSSIVRTLMETTLESLLGALPTSSIAVSDFDRAPLSEVEPEGAFDGTGSSERSRARGGSKRRALATGA